ncbi:hypothetical protein CsatB_019954 [Cannabis sativa]|uniref:uncharacterized protein LOC133030060 n=1 Tax=Cannabis sativa TaxID=3483 RepID=UPI0029CA315B|nr:uncharacterized protein LOC133030060 [Cannabis sativa]
MAAVMNNFSTAVLLIVFFCFSSLCLSSALPLLQDNENAISELTTISKTDHDPKGFSARRVGGRKVSLHKVVSLAKVIKPEKQGGSDQVEGKLGSSKQNITNGVQKLNSKQANSSVAGHYSAKINEAAGFVAFNADYRAPRHHPPKNNR